MSLKHEIALLGLFAGCIAAAAQQTQVQLRIEPANRTLAVSSEDQVSVDADLAILHVGFQTLPTDAKEAYADGAKTSNDIVNALKAAGIGESAIHSEYQQLESVYGKPHKFILAEQWTVRTTPARAAEILDVAVSAGANNSGDIEWTVENEQALADRALEGATERARAQAAVLAKGMGVSLGKLIYASNEISAVIPVRPFVRMAAAQAPTAEAPPLAIEPRKVVRSANVYAVFAIE